MNVGQNAHPKPLSEAHTAGPSAARVRSSYLWAAGGVFATQGIVWIISLWVARLLHPQDYGLLGMATVFLSFCRTLQDVGLGNALIQKRAPSREAIDSTFWFLLGISSLVTLLIWLLAPPIALLYKEPRVVPLIRVLSFGFVLLALRAVPLALLTKDLDFARRTKAEWISSVAGALTAVTLAWRGAGVWSLVAGGLATDFFLCVLAYGFCPWRPSLRWDYAALLPLLRFGLPATAATLLWLVYYQSDFFVIGVLLGPVALGFYTMAWQLAMVTNEKVSGIVQKVNFPVFSALQEKPEEAARHWLLVTEVVAWVSFPFSVGLLMVGDDFVRIALTPKWLPAVPVLRVLCLLAAMRSLSVIMPSLINALGHPRKSFLFNVVCTVVCPPAFVLGAVWQGGLGVAIAWVATFTALFAWLARITFELSGVRSRDYFRRLLAPFFTTALMAGVVFLSRLLPVGTPLTHLALAVGLGATTYLGSAFFWLRHTGRLSNVLAWLKPSLEAKA